MAAIRPSSDLRNKYNEISDFCNQFNEPVFITKNGTGDLVVLSNAESGESAISSSNMSVTRLVADGRNGRPPILTLSILL